MRVMAGEQFTPLEPIALGGLSFGIAEGLPLDRLDDTVAAAFVSAVARLERAGVRVSPRNPAAVRRHARGQCQGRHLAAGGLRRSSRPDARRAADIDPNVRVRIERGCAVSEADYADMMRERARLVRAMDARLAPLDVLLMPTTSIVAPTIAEVADPKVFAARNAAVLAQYLDHQFLRSVRHFAAAADAACQHAGRPHADRAQRPGSPAVCALPRR